MDNTAYSFQYTDNTTTGTGWQFTSPSDWAEAVSKLQQTHIHIPSCDLWNLYETPEKEDKMEVWEYVIVLLDEDDEKVEVKESGFVVAKDRDRAISKAAAECSIDDNDMVLVRKFCA